jgi:isoquinoline 1-oxidoreductase subunit beta
VTRPPYSAITFENGSVQQSNFHDYDVARMDSSPLVVYTHIVEHPFEVHATGVGEPACRRLRPLSTTRSSMRPASAFARCRSAIS